MKHKNSKGIIVRLPTQQEAQYQNKFTVYLHYIQSIRNLLKDPDFSAVAQSDDFHSLKRNSNLDLSQAKGLLRNCWLTEFQLNMPLNYKEFIPYARQWASVQLYYSFYLAITAFFKIKKIPGENTHTNTLKSLSNLIKMNPSLFLPCIKVLCVGNSMKSGEYKFLNLPNDTTDRIEIDSPLAKVKPGDELGYLCKLLKTTRSEIIEKKCADWKTQNNRDRIKSSEKEKILQGLAPTNLFHFFYRLRLRSNYADAEHFLLTMGDDFGSTDYVRSVCKIGRIILGNFELLIAKCISKNTYESWIKEFNIACPGEQSGPSTRWEKLKPLW